MSRAVAGALTENLEFPPNNEAIVMHDWTYSQLP